MQEIEHAGPMSEVEFWAGRAIDLGSLAMQLASERVQQICVRLEVAESSYAPALKRCTPVPCGSYKKKIMCQ